MNGQDDLEKRKSLLGLNKTQVATGCSSVVEFFSTMPDASGSIPITTKKKNKSG